jgi:multidrug efflux pump subunit AcrA (membrane-fusion protein)
MSTVRTIVFPALRLVVWAVIAVSLAVLAFGGGAGSSGNGAPAGGPDQPTVTLTEPTVPVARGTVVNTVTVDGVVAADPAVPVKATAAGTVRRLLVAQGATVTQGQALIEIRSETPRPPVTGTDAEGNPTVTERDPVVKLTTVPAPVAGRLTALGVLVDQIVAVGDVAGSISPGTLSVTATLTQAQQFRLLTPPGSAEVDVQGGPAPFTCTGLTLGAASASTDPGANPGGDPAVDQGGPPTTGGTTARCQVPPGTTVFAGMTASVAIAAGEATDVLVVPVTAVQGAVANGTVWVVADAGEPEERAVTLGLTDGEQIEVREGLTEGESVLQFVPVADDEIVDGGEGGFVQFGPGG